MKYLGLHKAFATSLSHYVDAAQEGLQVGITGFLTTADCILSL